MAQFWRIWVKLPSTHNGIATGCASRWWYHRCGFQHKLFWLPWAWTVKIPKRYTAFRSQDFKICRPQQCYKILPISKWGINLTLLAEGGMLVFGVAVQLVPRVGFSMWYFKKENQDNLSVLLSEGLSLLLSNVSRFMHKYRLRMHLLGQKISWPSVCVLKHKQKGDRLSSRARSVVSPNKGRGPHVQVLHFLLLNASVLYS